MSGKAGSVTGEEKTKTLPQPPAGNEEPHSPVAIDAAAQDLLATSMVFQVVADLCQDWAATMREAAVAAQFGQPEPEAARRIVRLLGKQDQLRKLVRGGLRRGESETIPRELVREEYELCLVAARQALGPAGSHRDTESVVRGLAHPIMYAVDGCAEPIARQFQVSKDAIDKIDSASKTGPLEPSNVAYALAGARFGISCDLACELARGRRKTPKQRVTPALSHLLLASAMTDVLQSADQELYFQSARAFDTLRNKRYDPYCLYYRLHHADMTPNELPASIAPVDLQRLVECIRQSGTSSDLGSSE